MTSPARYPACILATACVPWTPDFQLDEARFRKHVRDITGAGTRHVYIFGTAGEGYAVTEAQFDRITGVFVEEMRAGGNEPMVGIIHLAQSTVLERIKRAYAIGVREFQISLPSWGALNDAELSRFFDAVCGGFPDCKFLHYNLLRVKRTLTWADYARLAERHTNLVATKNTTDSMLTQIQLLTRVPQLRHFLSEFGLTHAGAMGREAGLLISLASTNWEMARRLFAAARAGQTAELAAMQVELLATLDAVIGAVGSTAHMDGAYDKILARVHDREFPLTLLPPYESASPAQFNQFITALKERSPRWMPA